MNKKTATMRVTSTMWDSLTLDGCKDMALRLDFPGDITEADIKRVVACFLNEREILPDLRSLKKYIRYVFGKRVGRIRDGVNGSLWLDIEFHPYAAPDRKLYFDQVRIDLPYRPVTMFKRI